MVSNEELPLPKSEGENNNDEKSSVVQEIIDLDASDDSDIEIIQISGNIGKRRKFKKLPNRGKTKVYINSVNNCTKNEQESVIKEEIIISDASDVSDDGDNLQNSTKHTINSNPPIPRLGKVIRRKTKPNQTENLSSIILNCPRCNKTEKVFSTTIKCICKECNVNMSYVCNMCNYRYESMPALYRHKKLQCKTVLLGDKTSPLKLFFRKCSKCNKVQREWRTKEGKACATCKTDMLYECTVCSATYHSYSGLYLHSRRQCQPAHGTYYCNDCDYKCAKPEILVRHLRRSHVQLYPEMVCCVKCGKKFKKESTLKVHEAACGVPYYKCKFCQYKPKFQKNLRKHLARCHKDLMLSDEDLEKIVSEVVSANSAMTDNDLANINADKEERDNLKSLRYTYCYKCDENRPFYPGRYRCATCNAKVSFSCQVCNKVFNTTTSIYRHIRRQHGKLRHCCNRCGRNFSFFGDANEHRKVCGKAPRYSCEICYFKTRYKYNLHCHMKSVHNQNRRFFTCGDCGVTYKTQKTMKKHVQEGCASKKTDIIEPPVANELAFVNEEMELFKAEMVVM